MVPKVKCLLTSFFLILTASIIVAIDGGEKCDKISLVFYRFNTIHWAMHLSRPFPIYHVSVLVCGKEHHYAACLKPVHPSIRRISIFPVINATGKEDEGMRTKGILTYFYYENKKLGKRVPRFIWKETVPLDVPDFDGMARWKMVHVLEGMARGDYDCMRYDLLNNNCATFARDFVRLLVGDEKAEKIKWPAKLKATMKMAKLGEDIDNFLNMVYNLPKKIARGTSRKFNAILGKKNQEN